MDKVVEAAVWIRLLDLSPLALGEFSIEAQHLDDSILALLENSPDLLADAARTHRMSLPN